MFLVDFAREGNDVNPRSAQLMTLPTLVSAVKAAKTAETNPVQKIAIGFILIAIALVIALAVFPIVADATAAAQASTNVTGASDTLLGLLPLLLVVGLLVGALAFLISGFRDLKNTKA